MEYPAIVTALILLQYYWFSFSVGVYRGRHGVKAPAITGHPEFERAFRVQQNTLEQLAVVLPGLWLFAWFVSPVWAAALGVVFMAGRFIYRAEYMKDPSTRSPGFTIGALAAVTLVIGGAVGAVLRLV